MISSDDRDGRRAVGSVHGLSMGNDVELLQSAFAAWRWCVHIHALSGDEEDSDGGGGSDDDQGSDDDDGDDDSDDDDSAEPIDDVEQRVRPPFGSLNPAGALLSSGIFSEFNAPGGGQDRIMWARFFDTGTCETGIQCVEASEQCGRCRRRRLQLRDSDHVEVLMIGQVLDLELMRDLFIQRILLRWRLFANRKHNTRVMRQIH